MSIPDLIDFMNSHNLTSLLLLLLYFVATQAWDYWKKHGKIAAEVDRLQSESVTLLIKPLNDTIKALQIEVAELRGRINGSIKIEAYVTTSNPPVVLSASAEWVDSSHNALSLADKEP